MEPEREDRPLRASGHPLTLHGQALALHLQLACLVSPQWVKLGAVGQGDDVRAYAGCELWQILDTILRNILHYLHLKWNATVKQPLPDRDISSTRTYDN